MWTNIHGNKDDLHWLVEGMQKGSLIWVMDGSYDRKRAPSISGAGWLIHCTASKKILKASFFEYSKFVQRRVTGPMRAPPVHESNRGILRSRRMERKDVLRQLVGHKSSLACKTLRSLELLVR